MIKSQVGRVMVFLYVFSYIYMLIATISCLRAQSELSEDEQDLSAPNVEALLELSLEDLVNVEVTLASKRTERLL